MQPNLSLWQTEIQPRLVGVVHALGISLPYQNKTEYVEMNKDISFLRDFKEFTEDYPIHFVA